MAIWRRAQWLNLGLITLLSAGCGLDPERRNPVSATGDPLVPVDRIEVAAELDSPPGNVTVASDGRVFFTFHPAGEPEVHVAELMPDGTYEPFPNGSWQQEREDGPWFDTPLSLRADSVGRLWVLDHGSFGRQTPSLTAFDIATDNVVKRIEFERDLAGLGSMLNDFWIDVEREVAYIADTNAYRFNPALIVLDLETGRGRRLLEGHESVKAEMQHMVVQGRFMKAYGIPLMVGADSIALSPDGETLFFGPMTGSRMFRVATSALRDDFLPAAELEERVEELGPKPSTDGVAADSEGNVYLTAIEDDAVWVMAPTGESRVLARDPELLSWPDGVHLTPDESSLYVTASELQYAIGLGTEGLARQRPFRILRIPLPGAFEGGAAVEPPPAR